MTMILSFDCHQYAIVMAISVYWRATKFVKFQFISNLNDLDELYFRIAIFHTGDNPVLRLIYFCRYIFNENC